MKALVTLGVSALCLLAGSSPLGPRRMTLRQIPPMAPADELAMLSKKHLRKSSGSPKVVFSCTRWGDSTSNMSVESPDEVGINGALFHHAVTGAIAGVVVDYFPKTKSKSHLVMADVRAYDSAQSIILEELNSRQTVTLSLSRGKNGHVVLVVPKGTAQFSLYLSSGNSTPSFQFSQLSIEELD